MDLALLNDIVAGKRSSSPKIVFNTLDRVVNETLARNDIFFSSIETRSDTIDARAVLDEMMGDGSLNWGRVIATFAFARRLNRQNLAISDFMTDRITPWVAQNGGWDALVENFPEPTEQTLRRGLTNALLVLTCAGLAVWALR